MFKWQNKNGILAGFDIWKFVICHFKKKGGGMAKIKVLLIDDEQDFCFFVKKNLELNGEFEVVCAYNGEEGFALAKEKIGRAHV